MHKQFQRVWKNSFPYVLLFLYCVVFVIVAATYINVGDYSHDYSFHLGRIIGLAQSIQQGDWLPSLNFVFEKGVGYASPIFYGNWMLYLPALLYLAFPNITVVYSFYIFLIVLFGSFSAYWVANAIGHNSKNAIWYGLILPIAFPWFGYGMTMVVPFVPLLFYAMYKVLYLDKKNPVLLGILIALLIQTHVLSTLVLAIYSALFVLFNIQKWSWAKIGSFLGSAILGLMLSVGYLLQYFEQVSSQTFFFNWTLRSYPFPLDQLMTPDSFWTLILESPGLPVICCLVFFLFMWKKLSSFSKSIVVICVVMLIAQSSALPWEESLRYTFLAILQDTKRLAFFVPALLLLVMALEWPFKFNGLFFVVQSTFFIMTSLALYPPNAENLAAIEAYNQKALVSLTDPEENSFSAIGDEYFNIVINQIDKASGILTTFESSDGVEVSNVKKGYNSLEFDYTVPEEVEYGTLYLPRVYYKGYVAEYSQGGAGSQPALKTRLLTEEEQEKAKEKYQPEQTSKALHNGKIYLSLTGSGHVKVYYEKTPLQILGFQMEAGLWALLGGYLAIEAWRRWAPKKAKTNEKDNALLSTEPPRSESLIAREKEAAEKALAASKKKSWWEKKKEQKQEKKNAQIEERLASTWTQSAQTFLDSLDEQLEIEKEDSQPLSSQLKEQDPSKEKAKQEEKAKIDPQETQSKKQESVFQETPNDSTPKKKAKKKDRKKKKSKKNLSKEKPESQESSDLLIPKEETDLEETENVFEPSTPTTDNGVPLVSVITEPKEPLPPVSSPQEKRTVVDGFFYVTYAEEEETALFHSGLQPLRYERQSKPDQTEKDASNADDSPTS